MDGRLRPDYNIRKEFHSTFDPLKHQSHVPKSPLYRPGQEQMMTDSMFKDIEPSRDNQIPTLPIKDDFHNIDDGDQYKEDRSPRMTDRIDPRYGSAKGRREPPLSPYANALQGRDSKLSMQSNDVNNNVGPFYSSSDREVYFQNGPNYKPALNGGGFGSYTDRAGQRRYHMDSSDKPWTYRRYDTPDRVIDPRGGFTHYGGLIGPNKLRHAGALLFIRFPTGSGRGNYENIAVASQAFIKSKTRDLGGKFLGLATSVRDFGYPDCATEAMGVYHFPTAEKALLFFQYDTIIRQPDFPPPYGHAEMWIVSNAYLPDNLDTYNTFLLSEIMLHQGRDKREFFEVFQKPFEAYLSSNGVLPFVVCSYGPHDRQSLRRHAYHRHAIVTCHLFQGPDHLRWFNDEDMYMKFRNLHNQMADEKCMVFTLSKNLCK